MIFNSRPNISNNLEASYSSGNCIFIQDTIFSPSMNTVKKIDLIKNKTTLLPFQNPHNIAIIIASTNKAILLSIDFTGHAVIFNLKGNFVIGQFNFKGPVKSATFSSDSKLIGIGQQNGFLVYQCSSLYRTFQPLILVKKYKTRHSGLIRGVNFSRDSRFILTWGQDNSIFLNNLFPIEGYLAISLQAHRFSIIHATFSHDMKYIYSFDSGNNLFIWKWIQQKTNNYQNLIAYKKRERDNKRGKKQYQQKQNTQISPFLSQFQKNVGQGRFILSKKIPLGHGGFLKRICFKQQRGFLACASNNGKFSIWRLINEDLQQVQTFSIGQYKISSIQVNDNCNWLLLGVKKLGQIIVWEWKSQSYILNQKGFCFQTKTIAYNNVNMIATGTNEGSIKLWDCNSWFSVGTLNQHSAAVSALKFSNSSTLFSSSLEGVVNAYDIAKQKKFRVFRPQISCQLVCLELQQNGQIVFAGSLDPYEVYAWNVQTGHLLQVITGHEGPLSSLLFIGQSLVSASWDHSIRLHSIFSRKINVQTLDHGSQVTALAASPSKKQIAAATMKGQIFLWEVQTGRLEGVLHCETSTGRSYSSKISAENDPSGKYLRTISYTPCGNYLIGGGKGKYLYLYDISHRMLLSKIALTSNKDIQGVLQKLNSRYIKNGMPTYQLQILAQNQVYSEEQKQQNLPGSKKLDISQIRTKLQAYVYQIVVKNNRQIYILTSFGTLVLSSNQQKTIFNPYQITPNLNPKIILQLVQNKQYSSALLVSLKLNINPRKLLSKIPINDVKSVVSQLQTQFGDLLLQKMCQEGKLNYRQLLWVDLLLKNGVKPCNNLRSSLQTLQQQGKILSEVLGTLQMALMINS